MVISFLRPPANPLEGGKTLELPQLQRVLGLYWHHEFIGEKSNKLFIIYLISARGSHNGLSPHSLEVLRLDPFKCLCFY